MYVDIYIYGGCQRHKNTPNQVIRPNDSIETTKVIWAHVQDPRLIFTKITKDIPYFKGLEWLLLFRNWDDPVVGALRP